MPLSDHCQKLLALADLLRQWLTSGEMLSRSRRTRLARYADDIADTLSRAALWAIALEHDGDDRRAERAFIRELGRLAGYMETLADVLSHHLDGGKLAGVKRRLDALRLPLDDAPHEGSGRAAGARINQLVAAEGYFRAIADGLRV